MNRNHAHTYGLVTGLLLAAMHLGWSLALLLGIAEPLVQFVLRLHMISLPFLHFDPFRADLAIALVLLTGCVGYVLGYTFGFVIDYCSGSEDKGIRHHPRALPH